MAKAVSVREWWGEQYVVVSFGTTSKLLSPPKSQSYHNLKTRRKALFLNRANHAPNQGNLPLTCHSFIGQTPQSPTTILTTLKPTLRYNGKSDGKKKKAVHCSECTTKRTFLSLFFSRFASPSRDSVPL